MSRTPDLKLAKPQGGPPSQSSLAVLWGNRCSLASARDLEGGLVKKHMRCKAGATLPSFYAQLVEGTKILTNRPEWPLSSKRTTPETLAKRVSSLPMPTLSPGLKRVPRWRTRIDPPVTNWPSKRFTPSRCALESRPLREVPCPFLCAMLKPSPRNVRRLSFPRSLSPPASGGVGIHKSSGRGPPLARGCRRLCLFSSLRYPG